MPRPRKGYGVRAFARSVSTVRLNSSAEMPLQNLDAFKYSVGSFIVTVPRFIQCVFRGDEPRPDPSARCSVSTSLDKLRALVFPMAKATTLVIVGI